MTHFLKLFSHILGFNCTKKHNLNKGDMDCAIRDFYKGITNNDCIVIYFSGHGMEAKVRITD